MRVTFIVSFLSVCALASVPLIADAGSQTFTSSGTFTAILGGQRIFRCMSFARCRGKDFSLVAALLLACFFPTAAQATTVFLTSGTSWNVPSDWNSANNTIEVIGGGGGGAQGGGGCSGSGGGGGGGGGAYAKSTNISLSPGDSVSYAVGGGGGSGSAGGDTYFCSSTSNCGSITGSAVVVGGKGGSQGSVTGGGAAGAAGSSVGATTYSGGNGRNGGCAGGGGGGGAAGPYGAGANGGDAYPAGGSGAGGGGGADTGSTGGNAASNGTGGAGGNGRGGSGGGSSNGGAGSSGGGGGGGNGSASAGGAGGSDTEWDASHGAGGGGGGGGGIAYAGGGGAQYGGGGGGGGGAFFSPPGAAGGSGAQGIIVITWTSPPDITFSQNASAASNFTIFGSVSKGSGTFVIDHPLDPKNKLLYHSFVESPDVANVYTGSAVLDENGAAIISLPSYFLALNTDFKYFATPLLQPMPDMYISKAARKRFFGLFGTPVFKIASGAPHGQVSWMVTGVRKDPYILANPIIPEVEKGSGALIEKGVCLFKPLCE